MAQNRFALHDEAPVYVISVAAELTGLHPQTLRQYDRLGLVSPGRAAGRGRRYSAREVEMLREVARLSADGVSLVGIKRILELERHIDALQRQVVRLQHEVATGGSPADTRSPEASSESRTSRISRAVVPRTSARTTLVVWSQQP
jgi:MerR family transcriptional regulator, heat shock protein HspR